MLSWSRLGASSCPYLHHTWNFIQGAIDADNAVPQSLPACELVAKASQDNDRDSSCKDPNQLVDCVPQHHLQTTLYWPIACKNTSILMSITLCLHVYLQDSFFKIHPVVVRFIPDFVHVCRAAAGQTMLAFSWSPS